MTETKPATYQTGETITVGDVVRIGNGRVQWRVGYLYEPTSRYDRNKTSASLDNLDRQARNSTRWVRDVAGGGLALVTPAADAEREANGRKAAERKAELERQAELRAAVARAGEVLDHPWVADSTGVTVVAADLRTLLAAVQR